MPVSEWRALVVNEVKEDDLLRGSLQGASADKILPVKNVSLPVDDLSTIAVLSWRWDGKHEVHGSRNVFCAIRKARELGIRYLFIDAISIDQRLDGDDLIRQVVAFSELYKTVPVIAAYDIESGDLSRTIRRPWISSEARLLRYNPNRIVYVGHRDDGIFNSGKPSASYIATALEMIWSENHTATILGVLGGQLGMASPSDLKYIVPWHARLFTAAFEKLSLNDYLLTAALCCQIKEPSLVGIGHSFTSNTFNRYTLTTECEEYDRDYDEKVEISLDGTKIAVWNHRYNFYMEYHSCSLVMLANAESVILAALGVADMYDEDFASPNILSQSGPAVSKATVLSNLECYSMDLESLGF